MHYDIVDASHADGDSVVYTDEVAQAVSDYAKARISTEVDRDIQLFEVYMSQYLAQRLKLFRDVKEKQGLRHINGVESHYSTIC